MFYLRSWILLVTLLLASACNSPEKVRLGPKPYPLLSEYGFFEGPLAALKPVEGVLPYDLNSPLFTDYAEKARFVWMPAGQSATFRESEVFDFPVGAVLIKNFFYTLDQTRPASDRRILETRLLIHRTSGWEPLTYIWDEDQKDATLSLVGDIVPLQWTDKDGNPRQVDYLIPDRNQCKGCHSHDNQLTPIGPKGRNLNRDLVYPSGSRNQLQQWTDQGYLAGYDPEQPVARTPDWLDEDNFTLHDRAMAYLDINCGHCHNPHGPAATSGLNLSLEQKLNANLGVFKTPVSAAKGSGGRLYSIVPGNAEASILPYRMQSLDPGAMMPEVGRTLVHTEGLDLIREWIDQMEVVQN